MSLQIVLNTYTNTHRAKVTIGGYFGSHVRSYYTVHFLFFSFHFLLVCPLYNRPRVTLLNAMGHIAPFTLRTLLYGDDNLDFTENKRIITETLRFINESNRFA